MVLKGCLVLSMLFIRVQICFQVTRYCLADLSIIMQLLVLLENPTAILVNHAAAGLVKVIP